MGAPQKFRQRYIAFETEKSSNKEELEKVIREVGQELDLSPPPWLILFDQETNEGLVKCDNSQTDKLKNKLNKVDKLKIRILGVSGTIKKARQKFLSSNK